MPGRGSRGIIPMGGGPRGGKPGGPPIGIGPPTPRTGPASPGMGPDAVMPRPAARAAPGPPASADCLFAFARLSIWRDTTLPPRNKTRPSTLFSSRSSTVVRIEVKAMSNEQLNELLPADPPPDAVRVFTLRNSSQSPRTRFMCLS